MESFVPLLTAMNFPSTRSIVWSVRRLAAAAGWRGALAAALLGVGVVLSFAVLRPLRAEVETLAQEADARRMHVPPTRLLPQDLTPTGSLSTFFHAFPSADVASDMMAKIYAAAAEHGIELERGEYRLVRGTQDRLVRYEIVLPVRGGYIPVRKFIAQALAEVPTLALDGIAFSRQKVDDPAVDAQLRMTLFLGPQ
jgi:hypothetical protein